MIIIIGFSGNCGVKLQVALIRLRSSFGWMFTFITFVLDLCTLCCRSCADNLYYYIRDSQRYCRGNCEPVVMCGPVKVPAGHLKGCRSCRADGSSCETGEAGEGVGKGKHFLLYVSAINNRNCNSPSEFAMPPTQVLSLI